MCKEVLIAEANELINKKEKVLKFKGETDYNLTRARVALIRAKMFMSDNSEKILGITVGLTMIASWSIIAYCEKTKHTPFQDPFKL